MIAPHNRLAVALLAPLLLSGCLGKLLGGGEPAQLYRLDASAGEPGPEVPQPAVGRTILLMPVRADQTIDGDRMLASVGTQTSYIAGARWVTPLPDQLEHALRSAVRRRSPSIALTDRRDGLSAQQAVQVTVSRFEACFPAAGAAPEIVIEGEAQLIDLRTRTTLSRLNIGSRRQAGSANVAGVVAAFDGAAADAAARTADWLAR